MISTQQEDRARRAFEIQAADFRPKRNEKWLVLEKFHIRHEIQPCSLGYDKHITWLGGQDEDHDILGAAKLDVFLVHDSIDRVFERAAERGNNQVAMDKRIYGGAPCIAGTRIPVYAILELVEAGYSHPEILKSFPTIGQQELQAALQFAIYVMENNIWPRRESLSFWWISASRKVCRVTLGSKNISPLSHSMKRDLMGDRMILRS